MRFWPHHKFLSAIGSGGIVTFFAKSKDRGGGDGGDGGGGE